MGALPVILNTFRCALNWTHSSGQSATNVIHITDPTGLFDATAVEEAIEDAAGTGMWAAVSSGAVVTDIAITPLDGVSATQHFTPSDEATFTGGSSGDFVPAVSVLVKLSTSLRGRSHRGRVFLPFITEGNISNGALSSTPQATMQTGWESFKSNLDSDPDGPFHLVVASYKLATTHVLSSINVEGMTATQRRRQGRLRSS
jgi:hypothetical protein